MHFSSYFKLLKNRYFIVTAFFVVWMSFFDQNDWWSRSETVSEIKELKETKLYYKSELEKLKRTSADLDTNAAALERYARERYFMKRDGEDVFVLIEE